MGNTRKVWVEVRVVVGNAEYVYSDDGLDGSALTKIPMIASDGHVDIGGIAQSLAQTAIHDLEQEEARIAGENEEGD